MNQDEYNQLKEWLSNNHYSHPEYEKYRARVRRYEYTPEQRKHINEIRKAWRIKNCYASDREYRERPERKSLQKPLYNIWYSKNKERILRDRRLSHKQTKIKARAWVNHAVRDGRLDKLPCAVCGNLKSEGHHDDYHHFNKVTWLCSSHHSAWHRIFEATYVEPNG